ncbi:chloride channel protein [Lyngbya aestuarii]|uniref:chloride channel protein n=1 Tax=Lyngbya aestuarii TaxID=118322 RepID=UPI00403D7D47
MKPVSISQCWSQLLASPGFAMVDACLIGLVSGLAAVLLKQGVASLRLWRVELTLSLPAWLLLPTVGLVGGCLAGWLVNRFAPETSGSGVPQVKAALAGFPITLNGRVAVVKLLSTTLALGSGLTLGRQGPTVQIGAALAGQLSLWMPTSPDYRRQMIAAGAAAGLAAGFNAPIAGVMFAVEELLHDISGLTLGPTLLASFIGAVISRLLGGLPLDLDLNLTTSLATFSAPEIPFYLMLGVLAGLLGVLFNKWILLSLTFNQQILRLELPFRVGLAGLICGLILSVLRTEFFTHISLREFLLSGEADIQTTLIALIVYFCLTIVASGSGAPGGLFAPTLVLGSALGHLVGLWQLSLVGVGEPTTYALTGMGALFCVVYKAPITGVVIIFEITRDFNLVLPLMISSVIAYLVSEMVDRGSLYDHLHELNGISLKKENPENDHLQTLLVNQVMSHDPIETLNSHLTLKDLIRVFTNSPHHAFPILEGSKLVGIVTQTDLINLYQQPIEENGRSYSEETPLREIMTTPVVTVSPINTLNEVLYLLNKHSLTRLPVTENGKLLGMITITDIIRAETELLSSRNTGTQST